MKLTDVLPVKDCVELEKEIHEASGMRPRVYDVEGVGVTDESVFGNELCARIQSIPKAQTFICAVAHNNMAAMAKNRGEPVVEECDAGMVKIVVPIFVDGEFIGAAGACGKLAEGEEVDAFMVNRSSGIPEEEVEALAAAVPSAPRSEMEALAALIQERLKEKLQRRLRKSD
jgi:ligand-binding sensor protein